MLSKLAEPVMFIVGGGTVLVQAVLQCLAAFGHGLTPDQNAAIMTLAGILLPLLARNYVTPATKG